jgi:hypothetical protein
MGFSGSGPHEKFSKMKCFALRTQDRREYHPTALLHFDFSSQKHIASHRRNRIDDTSPFERYEFAAVYIYLAVSNHGRSERVELAAILKSNRKSIQHVNAPRH